jgi:hypothetical protein
MRYVAPWIEISARLRSHRLWAVRALDREPGVYSRVPVSDSLRRAELAVVLVPDDEIPMRPKLIGAALERTGTVGGVARRRSEVSIGAAVEARF